MTDFLPFSYRNLILTGYIGPNQLALSRQIASHLRMPFVNVETEIADRVGLPVDQIRDYYGETRLKSIEAEIVSEAMLRRGSVIYISGRTLVHADHLARLQSTGPVICLVIGLDAMLHRLHINMGARYHDPRERALALGELKREWAIRDYSGVHVLDTTELAEAKIIEQVLERWHELAIERG